MAFSRPSGSIIDDLKDKLGFGNNTRRQNDDDDGYYDDYDMYGNDDEYTAQSQAPSTSEDDLLDQLEYTVRDAGTSHTSRGLYSSPALVTAQDIRATTSVRGVTPPASSGDISSATRVQQPLSDSSAQRFRPVQLDEFSQPANPYHVPATHAGDFASPYTERDRQNLSPGYAAEKIEPSVPGAPAAQTHAQKERPMYSASAQSYTASVSPESSRSDSYMNSYAVQSKMSLSVREITFLQPTAYEDVAPMAHVLKRGEIVVLILHAVDGGLSKRILDFSFGVASALDAKVECVGAKTFVIVQGRDLSSEERAQLQSQGIV